MIRGINRQMIVIKLEGSRLYDSACFLLRRDARTFGAGEGDMISEANRILADMDVKGSRRRRKGRAKGVFMLLLGLILGAAAGFGLSFLI